jgi:hypothetical protein
MARPRYGTKGKPCEKRHYTEDVHITQPLSLVAAAHAQPVINARGQPNGIFIDGGVGIGTVTPGANTLSQVTVAGFTIEKANFEGILVANASFAALRQNTVTNNNLFLSSQPLRTAIPRPTRPSLHSRPTKATIAAKAFILLPWIMRPSLGTTATTMRAACF